MKNKLVILICLVFTSSFIFSQEYEWNVDNTASTPGERIVAVIDANDVGPYDGVGIVGTVIDNNGNWGYNNPTVAKFTAYIKFSSGLGYSIIQDQKTKNIVLRLRKISDSKVHLTANLPYSHQGARVIFRQVEGFVSVTMGNPLIIDTSGELILDKPEYKINFFNDANDGNVGIGTSNPVAKLEVRRGGTIGGSWNPSASFFTIADTGSSKMIMDSNEIYGSNTLHIGSASGDIVKFRSIPSSGAIDRFVIKSNGYTGLGTMNPKSQLEINSQTTGDAVLRIEADVNNSNESNNARVELYQDGALNGAFIGFDNAGGGTAQDNIFRIVTRSGGVNDYSNFTINPSTSNVGIGTSSPDAKLTVNGDIHTKEVRVDLAIPAPDYVFKDSYDLLTIEEVQEHIQEKGHLPNIPSAKEMESNGVELGTMNMKLLEKIEELTLYTIAQEEQLKIQQEKNSELETRLAKLEKLLHKD